MQSSRAEEQLQEPGQRCREWPRSVSHCASATPVPGQRVLTQLRALHGVGPAARGPAGPAGHGHSAPVTSVPQGDTGDLASGPWLRHQPRQERIQRDAEARAEEGMAAPTSILTP